MSNQQFKVIHGLNANAQNISNAVWDGNVIPVAKGGTGSPIGALEAPANNNLTLTAGSSNNSVVLVPTGTGTVNVSGFRVTNMATPISGTDATTKDYVDNLLQGLIVKNAVKVATTANITLSGTQTIDGYSVQVNDRVLVKNQTAPAENGIYSAQSNAWTRTADANTWDELISAYVFVQVGTTQADTGWVCTVDAGGTLGTTAVTWAQFSGAGTFTAGQGLLLTNNKTFSIDLVGTSGKTVVTTTDTQTLVNKTLQAATVDTSISATAGAGSIINTSVLSASKTNTTFETLDSFLKSAYRSVSYIIQVTNQTNSYYQQSQINLIWKDATAYITEYAAMVTDVPIAEYEATADSTNVYLRVKTLNSSTNPCTFKILKSAFTL